MGKEFGYTILKFEIIGHIIARLKGVQNISLNDVFQILSVKHGAQYALFFFPGNRATLRF